MTGTPPGRRNARGTRGTGEQMADYESHQYDVIGAGGAGLRTAVEVQERGLRVVVVRKSLPGKAHTVMAEGA